MDEWKEIPGYPNYQINISTLDVKNISTNKTLVIRKGLVQLCGDVDRVSINIPRLLFCATRGINPNQVPRNILILMEDGNPVAYDRNTYMSEKIKNVYHEKSNKSPLEYYLNGRKFIDKVINAIQSDDYSLVVKELYSYYDKLVGRIIKNGLMRVESEAKELASEAIERVIKNIMSGTLVFFPYQYMYSIAKGIVINIRIAEKSTREFVRSNSNYKSYDE